MAHLSGAGSPSTSGLPLYDLATCGGGGGFVDVPLGPAASNEERLQVPGPSTAPLLPRPVVRVKGRGRSKTSMASP